MQRRKVFALIEAERRRQAEQWNRPHDWGWGDCSHDLPETVKLAVLGEEAGEVARAVLEHSDVQAELVQLAAVAVAWLESY